MRRETSNHPNRDHMKHKFTVDKALASLKVQGIKVTNTGAMPEGGMVRAVMGVMLTTKQTLERYVANRLDKSGIADFARRHEEQKKE
jgi:hypothetical protein